MTARVLRKRVYEKRKTKLILTVRSNVNILSVKLKDSSLFVKNQKNQINLDNSKQRKHLLHQIFPLHCLARNRVEKEGRQRRKRILQRLVVFDSLVFVIRLECVIGNLSWFTVFSQSCWTQKNPPDLDWWSGTLKLFCGIRKFKERRGAVLDESV